MSTSHPALQEKPFVAKYPFLTTAKEILGAFDRDQMFDQAVLDRATERVIEGINTGTTGPTPTAPEDAILREGQITDYEVELISYPTARILVSLLDDFRIVNQYAQAEAQTARQRLTADVRQTRDHSPSQTPSSQRAITHDHVLGEFDVAAVETDPAAEFHRTYTATFLADATDASVREFATAVFGIDAATLPDGDLSQLNPATLYDLLHDRSAVPVASPTLYSLPFQTYLRLSGGLTGDRWHLTNRGVSAGSVVVTNNELMTLLEQAICDEVSEGLPLDVPSDIKPQLDDTVTRIRAAVDDEKFSYTIDRVEEGVFPPVITQLVSDFPMALKHEEKVTLVSFLLHIGMGTEEVLEFLGVKGTPGEAPTKYQIDHISTGGDDNEPYTPANYDTIEAWGYTWEKDELEQSVTNPLSYYKIKLQAEPESSADTAAPRSTEESPADTDDGLNGDETASQEPTAADVEADLADAAASE